MFDTIYKYHVEVYYKDGTKIVSPTMETFSMKKTAEFANKIINTDPAFISKKVTKRGVGKALDFNPGMINPPSVHVCLHI